MLKGVAGANAVADLVVREVRRPALVSIDREPGSPPESPISSSSSKYPLLRSLEPQERPSRVPQTRIRGSRLRRETSRRPNRRLKQERIRVSGHAYDGKASDRRVYPDSPLRLSFTAPGAAPGGGAKTVQLWDPLTQNPLQDLDASNATLVDYIMGDRIDEPLGRVAGGSTHAFIGDHLMSVRGLADAGGALVNQYSYAAFGSGRSKAEAVANRLRFTARELDDATGQQYTRNRYLALALGRWTQRDPLGVLLIGNLYAYVVGNPISVRDPLGERPTIDNIRYFANYEDCAFLRGPATACVAHNLCTGECMATEVTCYYKCPSSKPGSNVYIQWVMPGQLKPGENPCPGKFRYKAPFRFN